jgi:hypothetical protein
MCFKYPVAFDSFDVRLHRFAVISHKLCWQASSACIVATWQRSEPISLLLLPQALIIEWTNWLQPVVKETFAHTIALLLQAGYPSLSLHFFADLLPCTL